MSEPQVITVTREQANELLESIVERMAEDMAEVMHDHFFSPDDPAKMQALRQVVKWAALARDLL